MGGRPEKPGASGAAQPLPDIRLVEHRRHSCYELVASLTIILSADSFIFRAMTPMIRPFRQQDADKLAALWHESWRSTGVQASSQTSLAQLRHRVSLELSDGWDVTVAEYEGDLLGFVALKRANHCLDQLFIAPRAKRLGIGRELFGLAKRAMPHGFWLRTVAENGEARAFYEAVGMKLVRIEPHPKHGHRTAIYVIGDLGLA